MKNVAKLKKTGLRKGDCFSCSYAGIVSRLLVFFYPVKGIWLIIKGSPWRSP